MRCNGILRALLITITTLSLAGCGGIGRAAGEVGEAFGRAIGDAFVNLIAVNPVRRLEGAVSSDARVLNDDVLLVGDDSRDMAWRSTMAFTLPASTVRTARLKLHIDTVDGDPFGALGALRIEAVELGDALGWDDYASPAYATVEAAVSAGRGELEVDVSDLIRAAQARGDTRIDLRLRMARHHLPDGAADRLILSSHDAGVDRTTPSLLVTTEPTP